MNNPKNEREVVCRVLEIPKQKSVLKRYYYLVINTKPNVKMPYSEESLLIS